MENKYNPNKHHRRSIRLHGYDYGQEGLYFITLCVQDRMHVFGEIVNGKMILNEAGSIAAAEWLRTAEIRDNVRLHECIIMPNHMHGILQITFNKGDRSKTGKWISPSHTIGAIVRGYKVATTKQIKELVRKGQGKGEWQFASTEALTDSKSESPYAPTALTAGKGEWQFAPTTIWQRNYYEHIIRNEVAYDNIADYIIDNPKRWKEDTFYK